MKIGIYGGSFNPPHNMHLKMATEILNKKIVDKIIFVPTGSKYPKRNLATGIERVEMIKLMIEDYPNLEVSEYELKQDLVYTYQTLTYFKQLYPNDEIYFILGSDLFKELSSWKNYSYILTNFKILVTLRNEDKKEELTIIDLPNKNNIIYTNVKLNSLSSTEIRKLIKIGQFKLLESKLNKKVLKYIKGKGMYKDNMKERMEKIVRILDSKKKTISTMESCTGGGVANLITNIEGSSDVINYSAVTYSNEFKIKMGVSKEVIDTYTVYSMETANEMSRAISNFANSNYGIGITGMLNCKDPANPSKNPNKIYISIYNKDNNTYYNDTVEVFSIDREENKNTVIEKVIEVLERII